MDIDLSQLLRYCDSVAKEFDGRLNKIRSFVSHNPTSGTANEQILRSFLAEHSSKRYTVAEGFVVNPFVKNKSSKQCDILVFDEFNYPVLHKEGEVRIVHPNSVEMVVEVKTTLVKAKLEPALKNIGSAKVLNSNISGVVFGFRGSQPSTLYSDLEDLAKDLKPELAPIAIINLKEGFLATRANGSTERGGKKAPFSVYDFSKNAKAVLVYFFLLFFDIQMIGVWGGADMANAWRHFLNTYTSNYLGEIHLAASKTEDPM